MKDGKFALDVTIPANVTATVCLPVSDAAAVQESGKPAAQAEGVKSLPPANGEVRFEVQSGTYKFTAPWTVKNVPAK